jgi:hypothetical protein
MQHPNGRCRMPPKGEPIRKRIVILVIVLVGAAGWAQSTMGTGQWLYGLWPSTQKAMTNQPMTELEDWNSGIFAGFVQGAAQVMWDADWLELTGTTYAQWGAVVGKYLDEHPEQWNLQAELLVYRALHAVRPGKAAAPYR